MKAKPKKRASSTLTAAGFPLAALMATAALGALAPAFMKPAAQKVPRKPRDFMRASGEQATSVAGARPPQLGPVPKGYRRWWVIVPAMDNPFDSGDAVLFRTWRAARDEVMDSEPPRHHRPRGAQDFIVPLDIPIHALSRSALAREAAR
jgi:hypothetical protein